MDGVGATDRGGNLNRHHHVELPPLPLSPCDLAELVRRSPMLASLLLHTADVIQQLPAQSSRNDTLRWLYAPPPPGATGAFFFLVRSHTHTHTARRGAVHLRRLASGGRAGGLRISPAPAPATAAAGGGVWHFGRQPADHPPGRQQR